MAYIFPFRALRYDPQRASLPDVVTQPYDKITPAMQDRYYAASPHNLVRIILGKHEATDGPQSNPYTRAATFFQDWRRQGIFLQESTPSIYRYTQQFTAPDRAQSLTRSGFIALGRIEDYSAQVIFRHEQTHSKPKSDRLNLLRATRAHFGQLFMLYSDPADEIAGLLASATEPDTELRDEFGVLHRLSRIADPNLISLVRSKMRDRKLIIADGHHRYETAINYRDERRTTSQASLSSVPRERPSPTSLIRSVEDDPAPYEMVMMTFVNMDAPGLVILPTHRVVHGLPSFSSLDFETRAKAYFNVENVDPSIDPERAAAILRQAGHVGTALLAVAADRALLLHTAKSIGSEIMQGMSLRQQSLDVVQLHRCLLEGCLGISAEAILNQQNISYTRSTAEALEQVRQHGANVAFLINPVRMSQVRDIAFASEVLPQKSTDFYPKLLSGLTIYALE